MISVNDLKNGLTLELDNGLWSVVEFLHVKPGKGAAFVRTKLKEGKDYVMMDNETYEQIQLTEDQVGDGIKYLKENMIVQVLKHDTRIIGVDIPAHVELEVVDTPPAEKGNTAQGGTKPATLETGAVVQVPFFVSNGDVIRVDTRSNEYLDRC